MVDSLRRHDVEVIALCVYSHHFHILARFRIPEDTDAVRGNANATHGRPGAKSSSAAPWDTRKDAKRTIAIARHYVGIAKKDSARVLSDEKLVDSGGVWAVRVRCLPVRDRSHQLNVYRYIEDHANRGAAVWTFHDDLGTSQSDESSAR